MKLRFEGATADLEKGLEAQANLLGFSVAPEGMPVLVRQRPGDIEVTAGGGHCSLGFEKKIHFFRALGLLVENLIRGDEFRVVEAPQFEMNGIMIDVSRNAVLTVESVKRILGLMAVMGLDMLMLYTKDTYEVPSQPYFGYMRGRYTLAELKECDDYADLFGIEMVPCIQALGHLDMALKWPYADAIKDTEDILLVGEERTYAFLEEMIRAAAAPFRSSRINLGMDEMVQLGLGKYLLKHGYRDRYEIMLEHLERVGGICRKLGLAPMMWSDLFFRFASETHQYYDRDVVVPEEIARRIPEDFALIYWDYYHDDVDTYRHFLRQHKGLGNGEPVFAGGVWTWNGVSVNYGVTFATTHAALAACKQEGVDRVFATLWGDDGAETNMFSALLGMQLYAEHGYAVKPDMGRLKERFRVCTGGDFDGFFDLSRLDGVPGETEMSLSNPSKFLLWQDVMEGLFDRHVAGRNLSAYYAGLSGTLRHHRRQAGRWEFVFGVPSLLADVLAMKSDLGVKIRKLYLADDREGLAEVAGRVLPELRRRVEALRDEHRRQWFLVNKAQGWEVMDIRYGGVLARIDSAIWRIGEYLSGSVPHLEELEEERLFFDGRETPEGPVGRCNRYTRIVTASYF